MDHGERFSSIRRRYPDYGPAWDDAETLPTRDALAVIEESYGCSYPPSFIVFQTTEAATTPMGDRAWDGFGWASPHVESYRQLGEIVASARSVGVPGHLAPFHEDEGNFLCFDTSHPGEGGEYPVVFWDHEETGGAVLEVEHCRWADFPSWLEATFADDDDESSDSD